MPSKKHERIRKILNTASKRLEANGKIPRVDKMRPLLEMGMMFYLLPWGVHFKSIVLKNRDKIRTIDAEVIMTSSADTEKIILYFHGGGYTIGSSQTHRSLVGRLAKKTGYTAILPEYAKAPEQPFPAAIEDAVFSYKALLERGKNPENIVLAGDSAGGGLIISAQLLMIEEKIPLPAAAICLSPWIDLAATGESIETNKDKDPLVQRVRMEQWAKMYAADFPVTHPLISPLYADLKGISPLLIQVSNAEMLYDDSLRLAKKAEEAGVDVTLQVFDGLMHWWHLFQKKIPEACEAIDKVADYTESVLK